MPGAAATRRHGGRQLAAPAALAVALTLAASAARAEPPPDPDADDQGDFWGYVLAPNGVEVASLIENGRSQVNLAHQASIGRGDPRYRAQRLREATAIANRVRALDPHAPGLDFLLGVIADESGRATTAEHHLGGFVSRVPPQTMRTEALLRLGRIALSRRDPAAALAPLRLALAEQRNRGERTHALVLLAQALDDGGDLDAAISLLSDALDRGTGPGDVEENEVWLALIAAYDRDEQLSASLDLVERLKSVLGSDYVLRLSSALDDFGPAPLAAEWYQRAVAYETGDLLPLARSAWLTYLGLAPARYRPRAQAHLDAIDAAVAAHREPPPPHHRPGAHP